MQYCIVNETPELYSNLLVSFQDISALSRVDESERVRNRTKATEQDRTKQDVHN
jgi:hypothetical protein